MLIALLLHGLSGFVIARVVGGRCRAANREVRVKAREVDALWVDLQTDGLVTELRCIAQLRRDGDERWKNAVTNLGERLEPLSD